jgi:hypothetical protein
LRPATDYQRFELAVTPTNVEAGEDILRRKARLTGVERAKRLCWVQFKVSDQG